MPKIPTQAKFSQPESRFEIILNAYQLFADRTGLSEKTIRNAFARKPITLQTAMRICRHLDLLPECFNIKPDNRGRRRKRYKLVPVD